jgi:hypothetical protein
MHLLLTFFLCLCKYNGCRVSVSCGIAEFNDRNHLSPKAGCHHQKPVCASLLTFLDRVWLIILRTHSTRRTATALCFSSISTWSTVSPWPSNCRLVQERSNAPAAGVLQRVQAHFVCKTPSKHLGGTLILLSWNRTPAPIT